MKRKFGPVPPGFARLFRTRKRRWLIAAGLILALSAVVYAAFFQSFETDTAGWFGATRVMSGTHLVPSKTGGFHAEDDGGAFTRWGGYSKTFPPGGYITSIDIYLDISAPYGDGMPNNDTRFDWSSAINTPSCDHRRDFVFNAGFYTDNMLPPRFVISASNNATRSGANPRDPGRSPITIYDEGWFTFEHRFRTVPSMMGLQLVVDLTVKDSLGATRGTWTLTDPSDIIGTTVGGNRYGWFVIDEFPFLAFDNSTLIGTQDFCTPASTPGAKITGGGWIDTFMGKGTFGLTARAGNDGSSSGNLTYQDHGTSDRTVKSTAITSVTVTGNCATIIGMATVNGTTPVNFRVDVCDNGEPGTSDTFTISTTDGYVAGGTLRSGNIQIH